MDRLPAARLSPLASRVDDVLARYGYEIRRAIDAIDDAVAGGGGLFEPRTTDDEIRAAVEDVLSGGPRAADRGPERLDGDVVLYVDGSSRGNPGPSGAGAVIRPVGGRRVCLGRPVGSNAENNVAEYAALQMGLNAVVADGPPAAVEVRIDSMTVIDDVWGDGDGLPSAAPFKSGIAENVAAVPECEWRHLADDDPNPADARAAVGADIAALGP